MNTESEVKSKSLNPDGDIKILISATEDAVGQVTLQQYYKDGKHEGKEFLLKMLDDLSNGAFVFS